jgi:hypothetical protein
MLWKIVIILFVSSTNLLIDFVYYWMYPNWNGVEEPVSNTTLHCKTRKHERY